MIADLRRSAVSLELWIALVITVSIAVLAVSAYWTVLGIVAGGVTALALAYLMIRWAWLMPVLIILGFALQPALKFYVSNAFGPAKDAVIVVAVAAFLATFLRRRWGREVPAIPHLRPDLLLVVGVLAFIALYAINPAGDHGIEWANGARLVVEAFALLLLGYCNSTPARTWRWLVATVLVMAAIEAAAGIVQQYIGVDRLVRSFGYLYGEQVRQVAGGALRSFGTLDDPFNYAALVLLGFIVAVQARLPRAVKAPLAVLLAVGVVVSFDRTDIVLMILAAALWMARRRLAAPAIGVLVAAALVGAAYIGTNFAQPTAEGSGAASTLLSLNGRIDAWGTVLADPGNLLGGAGVGVTGTGLARSQINGIVSPGRFQSGVAAPSALPNALSTLDSSYLATLSDVGLVGLLLLLFIAARMIILSARGCRTGSSAGWVALGTVGLLLLDATTRSSLTAYPFGFIGLYVFGASLAAAQASVTTQRVSEPGARRLSPRPSSEFATH